MLTFELRQIAGKAAGTYFVVTDNSVGSQNEIFSNLRVAPISSEKGNVNQLIVFKKGDVKAFENIFGKSNRRQEKRGNFSHSACIDMIKQGDLGVINLRSFDDELDKIDAAGLNSDGSGTVVKTVPYSMVFNPDGFWVVKDNLIIDAVDETSMLNFTNTSSTDLTIFTVFDNTGVDELTNEGDETLQEMEITVEEYPGLNPNMKFKDTFVRVFIFANKFDNALANEFYGEMFKQVSIDGQLTTVLKGGLETLNKLKTITAAGFLDEIAGTVLPYIKSEFDVNLSIDDLLNANSRITGLSCTINSDVYETEFENAPLIIDTYGQSNEGDLNLSVVKVANTEANKLKHDGEHRLAGATTEANMIDIINNEFYGDLINNSVINRATIKLNKDEKFINVDASIVNMFKNANLNSIVNIDDTAADNSGLGSVMDNPVVPSANLSLSTNPTESIDLALYQGNIPLTHTVDETNSVVEVVTKTTGDYYQFLLDFVRKDLFTNINAGYLSGKLSKLNVVNYLYNRRSQFVCNVEVKTTDNLSRIITKTDINIFPTVIVDFLTENADKIKYGTNEIIAAQFDTLIDALTEVELSRVNVTPDFVGVGITDPADDFHVDVIYTSGYYSTTVARHDYLRATSTTAITFNAVKPSVATTVGWPETKLITYVYNSYKLIVADKPLRDLTPSNIGEDSFGLHMVKPLQLTDFNLLPTTLRGIKLREEQLINGSSARQSEILDVLNSPSIVKGFKNTTGVRYFVDVFKSFVEAEYKVQFNRLVKTLDECNIFTRAIINEPFVTDLKKSLNPSFKDATGIFSNEYLKTGGNPDNSTAFINKPTLGAEMVYYYGSGHLDATENLQIVTPLVSGLFINKSKPWDIVANTTGVLSGITTLEDNPLDSSERKPLENFGWNPIIKKRRDFVVYGDFTGLNAFKKRKALSFVSNSELLAYIKHELFNMSLDENFKKGTYSEYIKFETLIKNFMDSLALQNAIKPNPTVICNFVNNTDDIQRAGIKLVNIEYYNYRTLDKVVFALDLN